MDLAWRGIAVVVAELRHPGEAPSVKCNHVAARTMEMFRRLGVAASVRDAGLPQDYPNDVAYRLTTTRTELTRIPIPCRADRYTGTDGPDTWWPTPEPPHQPQCWPKRKLSMAARLLKSAATTLSAARAAGPRHGASSGRSCTVIRKIGRVQSTFIRASSLLSSLKAKPAWGTFSLNARRSGNVYAIDGRTTWLVHNYLRPDEHDFDAVDRDASLRAILGVGADFNYEVIQRGLDRAPTGRRPLP